MSAIAAPGRARPIRRPAELGGPRRMGQPRIPILKSGRRGRPSSMWQPLSTATTAGGGGGARRTSRRTGSVDRGPGQLPLANGLAGSVDRVRPVDRGRSGGRTSANNEALQAIADAGLRRPLMMECLHGPRPWCTTTVDAATGGVGARSSPRPLAADAGRAPRAGGGALTADGGLARGMPTGSSGQLGRGRGGSGRWPTDLRPPRPSRPARARRGSAELSPVEVEVVSPRVGGAHQTVRSPSAWGPQPERTVEVYLFRASNVKTGHRSRVELARRPANRPAEHPGPISSRRCVGRLWGIPYVP